MNLYPSFSSSEVVASASRFETEEREASDVVIDRIEFHQLHLSHKSGLRLLAGASLREILGQVFVEEKGTRDPSFYHLVYSTPLVPYRSPLRLAKVVFVRQQPGQLASDFQNLLSSIVLIEAGVS